MLVIRRFPQTLAEEINMKRLSIIVSLFLLTILSAEAAIKVITEGASGSDVQKIERFLSVVESTAERIFGDQYPELKASIVCEVIVHGAATEKANTSTATLESSRRDGKLYGTLHILASSKYGEGLRSMGGQDKASDEYYLRLLGHEILSLYLKALSDTRAKGWAYYRCAKLVYTRQPRICRVSLSKKEFERRNFRELSSQCGN